MTIERTNLSGWGVGEKLTSAQLNTLDQNITGALDRRAGNGDLLASVVQATGSGRIIGAVATGPDRNWTFHFFGNGASASSGEIVRVPTLTAARAYTVSPSGVTGGDRMLFYIDGTGSTASGYANIQNHVGTQLYRLGVATPTGFNPSVDGAMCEVIYGITGWQLVQDAAPAVRVVEFESSTTWVVPPNVHELEVAGIGGGGGGGGGACFYGFVASGHGSAGGGGGGGALGFHAMVSVVPLTAIAVSIGAGGAGGAGGATGAANDGADGGDGGDSSFGDLTFYGAQGGAGGKNGARPRFSYTPGGGPRRGMPRSATVGTGIVATGVVFIPGMGGWGVGGGHATGVVPTFTSGHGQACSYGATGGGIGGIVGGGAGGGGGGGGWFPRITGAAGGHGGYGGTGGAGLADGLGPYQGMSGQTPGGWGGGGGGGGAGGGDAGLGGGGPGGAGGNGAPGKIMVRYVKR